MKMRALILAVLALVLFGCSSAYKAKPLSFKTPESYANSQRAGEAVLAAVAFDDPKTAREAFGFDVLAAGLLPVQVIFDNQGPQPLAINAGQTFLQDTEGNLWPLLTEDAAYERATKYAATKEIFKKGAYAGFLGATAGALVGAAVGVVSGNSVGEAVGKGAVLGGAAGAVLGGGSKVGDDEARRKIIKDLEQKSLKNDTVPGQGLSFGFLFFPAEAKGTSVLRLRLDEKNSGAEHLLRFQLH
ncbi:MAG: hypothetical protein KKA60_10835 [Proteobacteria bacterium]|nr:hypothetical protein [Pseudomonadota bacterium]